MCMQEAWERPPEGSDHKTQSKPLVQGWRTMHEATSLREQVQDTQRALAHDAHQPDFLFRDLSWHFTNITGDFPFCRWDIFSLEQKITLWKKMDVNTPYWNNTCLYSAHSGQQHFQIRGLSEGLTHCPAVKLVHQYRQAHRQPGAGLKSQDFHQKMIKDQLYHFLVSALGNSQTSLQLALLEKQILCIASPFTTSFSLPLVIKENDKREIHYQPLFIYSFIGHASWLRGS